MNSCIQTQSSLSRALYNDMHYKVFFTADGDCKCGKSINEHPSGKGFILDELAEEDEEESNRGNNNFRLVFDLYR